jgi:hypothetical protein
MSQSENTSKTEYGKKVQEFISELAGFAQVAEDTLKKIDDDKSGNKGLFNVFSERMLAIRGTALQLNLSNVAQIAGLGEEIALKGVSAESNRQVRKCVGSLWDALTTIQHLLKHQNEETSEEQEILMKRLQDTLKAFGGARPTVSDDEIQALLANRK